MIACVDIDGVLTNAHEALNKRLSKSYGVVYPEDEMIETLVDFLSENGISRGWLNSAWKDEWYWGRMQPYIDNIEALQSWSQDGVEIHIITGRPPHSAIPTAAWLKRYKVPYKELIFHQTMKKYEYMLKVSADFIVEDLFYEANKCAAYGFKSFVVRRPYNIQFEPRKINPLCVFVDSLKDIDIDVLKGE